MSNMLREHDFYYTPLKPKTRNFKFGVLDIETTNWTTLRGIGFYDGNRSYFFDSFLLFCKFLFRKKYRSFVIYAHNGGRFDFLPLYDELAKLKHINVQMVNIGSRVASLICDMGNGQTITFRDSVCILPSSLKKLSQNFKVADQKLEFDHEKEVFSLSNPTHVKYLDHDLKSLYQVIEKFYSMPKISLAPRKLTIASTALAIHRTTLKNRVRITPEKIQEIARQSYFGGRTEIFKHEIHNASLYDFTSVYPYCMRSFPIPVEFMGFTHDLDSFGFHRVDIFVPDTVYIPVLAVKKGGKLIFPCGFISGVYFSEEIKCAIMAGAKIIKHHWGLKFSAETDFFTEYVDFFFKLRQDNKGSALDYVAKLFLNGLYGKFSEREERQSLTTKRQDGINKIFGSAENFEKYRLFIETKKHRAPHMLVHIASAITAYARIHLYNTVLKNDETVAYCDTDSAFTGKTYNSGGNLGQLKFEKSVDYAYFRLPKTYIYFSNNEKIIRAKGFPSDYLNNVSLNDFKHSDLKNEQNRIVMFKSAIKRFNETFTLQPAKKSLISTYNKRHTMSDKIATRAWFLTKNGELK